MPQPSTPAFSKPNVVIAIVVFGVVMFFFPIVFAVLYSRMAGELVHCSFKGRLVEGCFRGSELGDILDERATNIFFWSYVGLLFLLLLVTAFLNRTKAPRGKEPDSSARKHASPLAQRRLRAASSRFVAGVRGRRAQARARRRSTRARTSR
jgi:hypothetical protein